MIPHRPPPIPTRPDALPRPIRLALALTVFLTTTGCVIIPAAPTIDQQRALRRRATEAVLHAVTYPAAGSIRSLGIEVMARNLTPDRALPRLRLALNDDQPGVRFAALLALGRLRDRGAEPLIRRFVDDPDANLRAACYFALHRLGKTDHTNRLPALLLDHPDADVRRNTAFILGRFDEPGAVKLLARAMKDPDESVRNEVLHAMARLGNEQAIDQLIFWTNSGPPVSRVAAVNTLADLKRNRFHKTFRFKLEQGEFVEVRLAAARALGLLKDRSGLALALSALEFRRPQKNEPADPPADQIMRVRQLAARALAAIGDPRALTPLAKQLNQSNDPRIQIAAADAILSITSARPTRRVTAAPVQPPDRPSTNP